ncbi:SAM-dependent methyltransferase [Zooshikella harenae]|uniref:Class I SAM-dependent methyltransferase n=1 Tax=Zooshikella harenae TaxID=2827238 RepID=A0ABS5ZAE7_9GAMM|nr:cyclopropane-fatty-acyl-phospholipid synthase family protein [Zooshikella harenae]MBU2709872.1 class I SAM-dependent methyltransferase [Zooshikella harenae]
MADQQTLVSSSRPPQTTRWWLTPLIKTFNQTYYGNLHLKVGEHSLNFHGSKAGPSANMEVQSPLKLLWYLFWRGDIGFAESYINNHWQTNDLGKLLTFFALNEPYYHALGKKTNIIKWLHSIQHLSNKNTVKGSKRNIAAHYDISNSFYQHWLDKSMTYSSAFYGEGVSQYELTLFKAQQRKYQRLLDNLNPHSGAHILEIGCGWGGFAEQAAQHGLQVTGITLSKEQLLYARQRLENAGLSHLTSFQYCDYRELSGQYDHIVSIEMLEAVGQEWWPTYFQKLKQCLKPGGRAVIQVITIDEAIFSQYQQNPDFIQLYIFPGGMLPTLTHLKQLAKEHQFTIKDCLLFGPDYAKTLRCWADNFHQHKDTLQAMGYDNRFQRTWQYYLHYCEAGFNINKINVVQLTLSH